jgi:hypothetical protein
VTAVRNPELRPEIVFLFDLVRQLVEGRIRIPRFQRPFVWRRQQMLDLLDSINNQYPIGSLLTWESEAEVKSLESIGPVDLTKRVSEGTAAYLLDGHQRLSTIAGALVAAQDRSQESADNEDPAAWNIYYNAEEQQFEHLPLGVMPLPQQFPMSKLLDTFEFISESQRVIAEGGEAGVARAFQNYKIPVIQIKQTGLTEAVEIFARLNSKGQSMTADQMVSALLYRQGPGSEFDLAAEITNSMAILTSYGLGGVDRTLVLRALLAAAGEDIYRTDWTRIAQGRREALLTRLQTVLPAVNESLEGAARFLRDEVGVTTDRLLPYSMQLVVISSLYYAAPSPSNEQKAVLKRWFWVTSFTQWFGGANPSRVNALVRDVIDNVSRDRETPKFDGFDLEAPASPLPRSFDMRSARTRVLLLALVALEPRSREGAVILDPAQLVARYGPDALGYVVTSVAGLDLSRSPANRMFRDDMTDRSQGRGWLLRVDGTVRDLVWGSHAMPVANVSLLSEGHVAAFLAAREASLVAIEATFMQNVNVTPPLATESAYAPADSD